MNLTYMVVLLASSVLVSSAILPLYRRVEPSNHTRPMVLTGNGVTYEVQVQVGNQTFYLIPDTGSSDLWVPVSDFDCVDPSSGQLAPQEDCTFGGTYQVPPWTDYVANQTFGVQYGTGIATGRVAYADVTLNGVTVPRQKIGLVDRTNDVGDGIGSGVLGLGFPALTSAHHGTQVDNTSLLVNRAVYDPLFVNMYKRGLVDSWYSFAIDRPSKNSTTGPGGYLGLAEIPPVAHSDKWTTKPIEVTDGLPDLLTGGRESITLMTLTVDGVTWSGESSSETQTTKTTLNSTKFQAVVDSGNQMNLFPRDIADSINDAFDPPGKFDTSSQVFMVDCDATTPKVGIVLEGETFWHQRPDDLIIQDAESGACYSSISRTGEGSGLSLNFLGDAFLRNVVSLFDFGKNEMRFASRTDDGPTDFSSDSGSDSQPESAAPRAGICTFWLPQMVATCILAVLVFL